MKPFLHSLCQKESVFFRIAGIICCFFQITGYLLSKHQHIAWSIANTIGIFGLSLLLGTLLGSFIYLLFQRVNVNSNFSHTPSKTLSFKHFFLLGCMIFVCWLPFFFAYFPGICSYDFSIQMGQVESGAYSDHHPFMHTLLIQLFWNLGRRIFSSGTIGIALYTIFQMLFLLSAFVYSLHILNKCGTHKYWLFGLTAFYALFPPNIFMSISSTKDTIFAAFVLFMTASFLYVIRSFMAKASCKPECIVFVLSTIGTVFFRNNGRYALLVMIAVILLFIIFHRPYRVKYSVLLSCSVSALVIAIVILNLTQSAIHCTQGDRREMLSIPIQQWARIINRHEQELDTETVTFIKQCIDEEGLYAYDPYISDPVKRHTHTNVILNNAGTYIKTYLNLFFAYPDEYINAFLIQNSGFLYIFDTSHAWINHNPDLPGYGYIQTREVSDELAGRDIYKNSLMPKLYAALEQWTNENSYLRVPILNILMAPGIWFSVILFMIAAILTQKNYQLLIPMAFILGYYLTLFLGPTVQLRYIYPVMLFTAFALIFTTNFPKTSLKK